ncbi:hypothetical protein DU38_00550 [Methanosarcina mazei]|uniref:Glycosyltransferase RgtA/B/C/D-like domain-containing protein n=2 Tax=Methanosarcina mazei TaxID=2209 RepID=A0A0F8HFD1_METMZ|nr:hypothetical protein [Methanosarcina mazei]KKG29193.1 hypothetical protein DU49_12610 [Methanosarcina mazei]KKG40422.1 hypothetical protein DU41_01450 [Methanosarcina mazei]KKG40747.1 hypothetical protein DU35_16550 [Methanosarcina mazei]KKG43345.1 hypothetical protein DU39_19740 [Methanosarcina mazei]KKG53488.1 hypothetical protein DU38_00550 [Methanosarcina mazei]
MQGNSSSDFDIQYNPSRRTKFLLMGLLLVLNIIIRIPSIPHEKGYDSFFIHNLANSLTIFGSAKWWISWLSVFGFYPDSYSSAVPFTLSGMSQVMGIEMEKTILLFCIIIGIFGICTIYVFAERIYNSFQFKYIMSLFFSLAPGLMLFTTWEVSTRGQFIVFFPLFLYILLKEEFKFKKYILLPTCLIFIFSTHHYAFFLVPISIIYISLKAIQNVKPELFKMSYLNYILLVFFLIALTCPFFTGLFISSGSRYTWILNAIITNIRQTGPLVLFIPGGLAYLFLKKKTFEGMFMCLTITVLAPIFYSQIYGPFVLILISIFIISIAFNNLLKLMITHKNKLLTIGIVAIILLFVSFSSFYNHYRTGSSDSFWYMQESTYASGTWAKNHIPENARGLDTGMETSRFFAISEAHPITTSEDILNLVYGWTNESDIVSVKNSPLSLQYYFEGPYSKGGSSFSGQMEWIKYAGTGNNLKNFDYFIQDKYQYKPIVDKVQIESSLIYDSPRISVWKIPKQ